jgi:hypothetical protein
MTEIQVPWDLPLKQSRAKVYFTYSGKLVAVGRELILESKTSLNCKLKPTVQRYIRTSRSTRIHCPKVEPKTPWFPFK